MMGGTKSRRSPNNLPTRLRECAALIIGPAPSSAVEKASAVFCWPQPSGTHYLSCSSCDRSR